MSWEHFALLGFAVLVAYALAPKPWAQPVLRVIENEDGTHFRVQYQARALWGITYWVDTHFVRSAGKSLPFVYPSRELAEAEVHAIRRKHELRNPRKWQ